LLVLEGKTVKRIDFKWADNILENGQPKDFHCETVMLLQMIVITIELFSNNALQM
jgi:hypothetical protein